jgi:hypothetical protein
MDNLQGLPLPIGIEGKAALALPTGGLPPVDFDQPLAFRFAPDDSPWIANARIWYGDWINKFLDSPTADYYIREGVSSMTPPE